MNKPGNYAKAKVLVFTLYIYSNNTNRRAMRIFFITSVVFFFYPTLLYGQQMIDDGRFSEVDAQVAGIRRQYIFHPDILVQKLIEGLENDYDKARAIYVWIATNIDYDLPAFTNSLRVDQSVNEVLVSGKGLCVGYSLLFDSFCKKAGLQSEIIDGYAKGYGYRKDQKFIAANHAWNAVNIYGTWYLLDVTWAAGDPLRPDKRYNKTQLDEYFLVSPEVFVRTHLPEDPTWQLLDSKVSLAEFESGNLKAHQDASTNKFSPGDYEGLNEFDAEIEKNKRSLNFNPKNYGLYQQLSFAYMYKAISITDEIHKMNFVSMLDTLEVLDSIFYAFLDSAKMTIANLESWKIPNFNKILVDETNFQKGVFRYEMGTELFHKARNGKYPLTEIAEKTAEYYRQASEAFAEVPGNSIYFRPAKDYLSNIQDFQHRQ